MPAVNSRDLPQKGSQVRILLDGNRWLYCVVENIAPTGTFFTMRVLGLREVENEYVGEPSPLKDPKDQMGPLLDPGIPLAPSGGRRRSGGGVADPSLPPSPALEVEKPADSGERDLF